MRRIAGKLSFAAAALSLIASLAPQPAVAASSASRWTLSGSATYTWGATPYVFTAGEFTFVRPNESNPLNVAVGGGHIEMARHDFPASPMELVVDFFDPDTMLHARGVVHDLNNYWPGTRCMELEAFVDHQDPSRFSSMLLYLYDVQANPDNARCNLALPGARSGAIFEHVSGDLKLTEAPINPE